MEEQQEPSITFEGKTHKVEDLSEQSKYFVSQIQDLSKQIGGARARVDQLEMARKGFEDLLRRDLTPKTEIVEPEEIVQ